MNDFDVMVIGGGAAGMSAALVLLRARRSVVVVDGGAPRNAPADRMHGFLSRDGSSPRQLLAEGRAELLRYGGVVLDDDVVDLTNRFEARLGKSGRQLTARRVLVATGLIDELPEIPGLRERWGRDVLHCPYCHGYEVRDLPLAVLGGTPEAVQHAILIRQWSPDLIFFPHTDPLDDGQRELLAARSIRVVEGVVAGLDVLDDRLRGVRLTDGRTIERTGAFVRPRPIPNSVLLVGLGCATDDAGWVIHDATGRTTLPGVWVAGNAADPRAQVITAAGQGSAAAIAINADLVAEDTERALDARRRSRTP